MTRSARLAEEIPMLNVLFICSQNRLRSPTAESVFSGQPGVNVMSAGTNADADNPVSADLVEWADLIFVMEEHHRRKLNAMFGSLLRAKRLIVLGIPDNYDYMDPGLVKILRERVPRHLPDRAHHADHEE
jgi:predicted protein tyrosine phosphatase